MYGFMIVEKNGSFLLWISLAFTNQISTTLKTWNLHNSWCALGKISAKKEISVQSLSVTTVFVTEISLSWNKMEKINWSDNKENNEH
jgi:hypothetical protein